MTPKMQPFWWFKPPPITYIDLPVNLFKGSLGHWATGGANPWLDTDDGDTSWIGWFGGSLTWAQAFWFTHTTLTSFSKVEIHIKARQTGGFTEADVIWMSINDVDYTSVYAIGIASADWFDFYHDITDFLDTIAKINSASMAIQNVAGAAAHITYAFLRVYL
jgi:hypothetical protein